MRVLVVEDERMQAEHVASAVEACGFECDVEMTRKGGCAKLLKGNYDIAFIDIRLGDDDGTDIIHSARLRGVQTYLIVLSSFASQGEKHAAFAMGADDFLTKPVSRDELIMRLKAIARRLSPVDEPEILKGAGVVVNVDTQEVRRNGRSIKLSPRETKLLILLMRNASRAVPTDTIVEHVWGDGIDPDSTVVQANISRLRKKLRLGEEDDVIHTVRDIGYVFK